MNAVLENPSVIDQQAREIRYLKAKLDKLVGAWQHEGQLRVEANRMVRALAVAHVKQQLLSGGKPPTASCARISNSSAGQGQVNAARLSAIASRRLNSAARPRLRRSVAAEVVAIDIRAP